MLSLQLEKIKVKGVRKIENKILCDVSRCKANVNCNCTKGSTYIGAQGVCLNNSTLSNVEIKKATVSKVSAQDQQSINITVNLEIKETANIDDIISEIQKNIKVR
jgi:hypothetical protein